MNPDRIKKQKDGTQLYMKLGSDKQYLHILVVKFEDTEIKLITYFKTSKTDKYLHE